MLKLVINSSDRWCQKGNGLRILVIFTSTFFIYLVLNSVDVLFTEVCKHKKELGPPLPTSSQCQNSCWWWIRLFNSRSLLLSQQRCGRICEVNERQQTQKMIRQSVQITYLLNVGKWVAILQVKDYTTYSIYLFILFGA